MRIGASTAACLFLICASFTPVEAAGGNAGVISGAGSLMQKIELICRRVCDEDGYCRRTCWEDERRPNIYGYRYDDDRRRREYYQDNDRRRDWDRRGDWDRRRDHDRDRD
jgi:hypothetical protein